jgi:hypothetical protein
MVLERRDSIFLRDFVQFNWMQRVVTMAALYEAGVQARTFALPPMRLYYPQKSDKDRLAIIDREGEVARVQSLLMARLFGEFFGALEDTGAFLRAIRERRAGGILANNLTYAPGQVTEFFQDIRATRSKWAIWRLLRFPDLGRLGVKSKHVVHSLGAFPSEGV